MEKLEKITGITCYTVYTVYTANTDRCSETKLIDYNAYQGGYELDNFNQWRGIQIFIIRNNRVKFLIF